MSASTKLSARLLVLVVAAGALYYASGGDLPSNPYSDKLDEGDVQFDVTWPSTPQAQIGSGYKPGPDSRSEIGSGGHWTRRIHLKPGTYVVTVTGRPIPKTVNDHSGRRVVGSISTCTISTKDGQKSDQEPSALPGSMCAVTQVVVVKSKEGS